MVANQLCGSCGPSQTHVCALYSPIFVQTRLNKAPTAAAAAARAAAAKRQRRMSRSATESRREWSGERIASKAASPWPRSPLRMTRTGVTSGSSRSAGPASEFLDRTAFGRRPRRRFGHPPLPTECRQLILRLVRENPGWGFRRIKGELRKLGYQVSATSIRGILRRHRVPPAPRRAGLSSERFLRAQAGAVLALLHRRQPLVEAACR